MTFFHDRSTIGSGRRVVYMGAEDDLTFAKMGKLLFGSNAQFVILNAACPVLAVK
jgi:nucleotide-binding universal stress UspA family protein